MNRADFVSTGARLAALAAVGAPLRVPAASTPLTGSAVPQLQPLERFILGFMAKYSVPGAQCAVAKDGRIVYERGFGYADEARRKAVRPDARFRIASCSKPITAVAVMQLVEAGRLHLDEKAFHVLSDLRPADGAKMDPRLRQITIRHLLEHSGGFDSSKTDPQFDALRTAAALFHHEPPATHTDIIQYMMGKPLAFDPGTKFVYSNLGYNILGRVIEHRTGTPYGVYVTNNVLRPAGAVSMRLMNRTSPSARLNDEVFYADGADQLPGWSIYRDDLEARPYSYGGFDGAAIDAHGGWISSAADLVRFLNAVDGDRGTQLLKPQTVATMLKRPSLPQYQNANKYYALGWDVSPGVTMSHNGALTFGTLSSISRLSGGITFAILFNHLSTSYIAMVVDLEHASVRAMRSVTSWPM